MALDNLVYRFSQASFTLMLVLIAFRNVLLQYKLDGIVSATDII